MKTFEEAKQVTPAQLSKMAPREVDEYFEAVWEEHYRRQSRLKRAWTALYHCLGARNSPRGWNILPQEALNKAQAVAKSNPEHRTAQALAAVNTAKTDLEEVDARHLAKLDDEYARRPWERCHLALTNGKGHIHSSRHCSTCNNGTSPTRFHWMIDWSGKSRKEIIEAAGTDACSVCYPDAPVAKGLPAPKRTMFAAVEIEQEKARQGREAAKQRRAEEKAQKAIADADGSALTVYTWTRKAHRKVVRGREMDVPEMDFSEELKTLHAARGWLTDQFDGRHAEGGRHRDLDKVADAVACKEGKDRATVLAEAQERAKRRR